MKRFFAILLIFVFITSTAMASPFDTFHISFDGSAKYVGVHEIDETLTLDMLSVYEENDSYMIGFGAYDMAVIFSGDDVNSVTVYLNDKDSEVDYLLTCLAVILTLGDLDFNAMGYLLNQFAYVRQGKAATPAYNGQDAFLLSLKDDYVYCFTYMNNDLAYGK